MPVSVVNPEPDFERADVPLGATHVALSREARIDPPEEHRSGSLLARRQAYGEPIAQADPVDVGLLDVGPDPEIVRVDQGHDRLARVHELARTSGPHIDDAGQRGP